MAAPAVDYPVLSWFGASEIGEGIVWYLELAILTACAMFIARLRRVAVAGIATLSIFVVCSFSFWAHSDAVYSPYPRFCDHFAFYGICLPAILIAFLRVRAIYALGACLLPGLVIIASSGNRAAMLFCFVVAPVVGLLLVRRAWPLQGRRLVGVTLAAAVPFVGTLGLYQLGEWFGASHWSRARLSEIVWAAVTDNPVLLVTGAGWGRFTDTLLAEAALAKVRFLSGADGGSNWDALERIDFHSHNFLAEALLSAGLIGAVLVLALVATVPWFCRARFIGYGAAFGTMLAGVSTAWFQYSGSLPYLALALGALARPVRWRVHRMRDVSVVIAVIAACSSIVLAATLERSTNLVRQTTRITNSSVWAKPTTTSSPCGLLIDDFGRGGTHLAPLLTRAVSDIREKLDRAQRLDDGKVHILDTLLCAVDRYIDREDAARANVRLAILAVAIRSDLAFALKSPALETVRRRYLPNWASRIDYMLSLAPKRSDLAAPYLYWRLSTGDDAAVQQMTTQILRMEPHDIVGRWFHGITLLSSPKQAQRGLAQMRASLDAGLEDRIPVESVWRELLMQQ